MFEVSTRSIQSEGGVPRVPGGYCEPRWRSSSESWSWIALEIKISGAAVGLSARRTNTRMRNYHSGMRYPSGLYSLSIRSKGGVPRSHCLQEQRSSSACYGVNIPCQAKRAEEGVHSAEPTLLSLPPKKKRFSLLWSCWVLYRYTSVVRAHCMTTRFSGIQV